MVDVLLEVEDHLVLGDELLADLAGQLLKLPVEVNHLPMESIAVLESLSCLLQIFLKLDPSLRLGLELPLELPDPLDGMLQQLLLELVDNPRSLNAIGEAIRLRGVFRLLGDADVGMMPVHGIVTVGSAGLMHGHLLGGEPRILLGHHLIRLVNTLNVFDVAIRYPLR